jgi:hypothetical protein
VKCRITAWKAPDARRQVRHATGPRRDAKAAVRALAEELKRAHGMRRIYIHGGPVVAVLSACPGITV